MQARRVAVTGMGVVTTVGEDLPAFTAGLRQGKCGIATLRRIPTGRIPVKVGAELDGWDWRRGMESVPGLGAGPLARSRKILHRTPESTRLSACAAAQALARAGLLEAGSLGDRVGLIVGGSNLHQRYIHENGARFHEEPEYLNPTYALSFMDSSQVGCLSELFGLHGMGYTVGAASASGNVALYHAWQWIRVGVLDACVVVGASADFSEIELQAFSILGAACGEPYAGRPEQACRPFDRARSGFVFGEGGGCMVLEALDSARGRGALAVAEVLGGSLALDGNALANPSLEGEIRAMRAALRAAELPPEAIDYVNAHGSSSVLGDQIECEAIRSVFGERASSLPVNSTKSLTGHCMFAAGIIECIATVLQLEGGFLHPNLNLEQPLGVELGFAGLASRPLEARRALSNGFGFGGFNSSLVIGRIEGSV